MTSDLVDVLACPLDGASPLKLRLDGQDVRGEIRAGWLVCPDCDRAYPIEDGVPRLLPDAGALPTLEAREKESERCRRDAEAATYDRNLALRLLGRWEIPATLGALSVTPSECLLEVGCGTGRFTHRLAPLCRRVIAIDFSLESLRVARARTPVASVQFIQADASYLPLRDDVADRALSCQMLEHLPTVAARQRAVAEVARVLRSEGTFVSSAYWYSPLSRLLGGREGHHSGSIYFYRFTRAEFTDLLSGSFEVQALTTRLVYVLLARAVKRHPDSIRAAQRPSILHDGAAAPVGPRRPS